MVNIQSKQPAAPFVLQEVEGLLRRFAHHFFKRVGRSNPNGAIIKGYLQHY